MFTGPGGSRRLVRLQGLAQEHGPGATGWSGCSSLAQEQQQHGPAASATSPGGCSNFARRQQLHGPVATAVRLGQAMQLPPGAVAVVAEMERETGKEEDTGKGEE